MAKYISLTHGKVAIVDNEGFEELNKYKWCALQNQNGDWYAWRKVNGRTTYMHREILKTPGNLLSDHIDGDGLNNLKSNLRIVTQSLNQFNRHKIRANKTSRFLGVYWHVIGKKWGARIMVSGISKSLGLYKKEEHAAKAYNDFKNCLLRED